MSATPHVSADVLRTLHRIHRQLTDLRSRLERGPKRVAAAEAGVAHREQELERARREQERLRKLADSKQLDLRAGEDKVRELQRKLNEAASNTEYQALKEQIEAKRMANSVLEDEILEAMEATDQQKPLVAQAETVLQAARAKAAAAHKEYEGEEPRIRADLERLQGELQQAEAELPAQIRDAYARVVRQRGEDALAPVENEYCGGCHQHVPVNLCAKIIMGEPIFCRTCGRMLYMPEERGPERNTA